jgi:hypothetical protein
MSEQEREHRMSEEPDVEGHRARHAREGSEPPAEEAERRKADDDDDPDVEGHRVKHG